jgi:hypothetical protein
MQMVLQRLLEHEQYHFNLHFADADTHEDSAGVSLRPRASAAALCFLGDGPTDASCHLCLPRSYVSVPNLLVVFLFETSSW